MINTMSISSQNILKVLIADDDEDDQYLMDLAFKEAGLRHLITFVKNGAELIEALQLLYSQGNNLNLPDLILLDLNMPKKDGRVALKEIRCDPRFQMLNIIIFSTCISDEDRASTAALGVMRHIIKPHEFSSLVKTMKEVCESCFVLGYE